MTFPAPGQPKAQQVPQRPPLIARSNAALLQLWLLFWLFAALAVVGLFTATSTLTVTMAVLAAFVLVVSLAVSAIAREFRGYRF